MWAMITFAGGEYFGLEENKIVDTHLGNLEECPTHPWDFFLCPWCS
jgi:hypothetical protein